MELNLFISVADYTIGDNKFVVHNLSNSMKAVFKERSYGIDVLEFSIGFIMARTRPGYEAWYKPAKPKFIDFKNVKSKLTGEVSAINKKFCCEIKLSDEVIDKFVNASEIDCYSIIACEVLDYLRSLNGLPKRIKDFDLKLFISDVEDYFTVRQFITLN